MGERKMTAECSVHPELMLYYKEYKLSCGHVLGDSSEYEEEITHEIGSTTMCGKCKKKVRVEQLLTSKEVEQAPIVRLES